MAYPRSRYANRSSALIALAVASVLSSSAPPASQAGVATLGKAQVGLVSLADPSANIAPTQAMKLACNDGIKFRYGCQQAVVQAIDQARRAEGVVALVLPHGYDSISVGQQLLVLANLERVDRGLPGFSGLSTGLNALALVGAASNGDPTGPPGTTWGSNWAGGEASALLADFDWMYDDGPGSPNLDCTGPLASGCWDHRRNVLGQYGPHPAMGSAATQVKGGVMSMTEVFSSGPAGRLEYRLPLR